MSLPSFGVEMINDDFHIAGRLKRVVMYSMLQVEDAELVGAKGLTISTVLD